jgi:hypothetical protein
VGTFLRCVGSIYTMLFALKGLSREDSLNMTIDYNNLVKGYYDGLVNNLRNFSPGPEFLESWVHDEDHERSLFGIFEAAKDAGLTSLSVTVEPPFCDDLNMNSLNKELSHLGKTKIESQSDKAVITVELS